MGQRYVGIMWGRNRSARPGSLLCECMALLSFVPMQEVGAGFDRVNVSPMGWDLRDLDVNISVEWTKIVGTSMLAVVGLMDVV